MGHGLESASLARVNGLEIYTSISRRNIGKIRIARERISLREGTVSGIDAEACHGVTSAQWPMHERCVFTAADGRHEFSCAHFHRAALTQGIQLARGWSAIPTATVTTRTWSGRCLVHVRQSAYCRTSVSAGVTRVLGSSRPFVRDRRSLRVSPARTWSGRLRLSIAAQSQGQPRSSIGGSLTAGSGESRGHNHGGMYARVPGFSATPAWWSVKAAAFRTFC